MTKVKDYDKNHGNKMLGIEKKVFQLPMILLQLVGFWKPTVIWSNKPLSFCYNIYTLFTFVSVTYLTTTIIIDNAVSEKSVRDLIEIMYLLLVIINGYTKAINLQLRKPKIMKILLEFVEDKWADLRDDVEVRIVEDSMKSERVITRFCIYCIIVNGLSNGANPFLNPDPEHDLMIDAYSPCDRRNPACFWASYIYQVFGYMCISAVHVGCDNLAYNVMERLCAHFRILEHRILLIPELVEANECREVEYLKECIKDHQSICETIKGLDGVFREQIFMQYLASILVLCTNIYLLSVLELMSADFIATFMYLCCVLIQNFCYCWYAYGVLMSSLHLSDAIFTMSWWGLKKESKKMLTFMMLQASKRIYICKSAVATLTPESFVNILKLSYSAFNILQQTSKK